MTVAEKIAADTGAVGLSPVLGAGAYNFAADVLKRNLDAGRAGKPAYIDGRGTWTYGQLADRVNRFGAALRGLGVRREERVLMAVLDTVDWPTAFLGCLKAGIIAVPVNTLLTEDDYRFMLADSRAKALVVSEALFPRFEKIIAESPDLEHVIVSGANPHGYRLFEDLIGADEPEDVTAATVADDMAFWLYTSGSTGKPKGAVHVHGSLKITADLYGTPVVGLKESDVVHSVAKLFFAYGLGNAMTFPLSVGATVVLNAERPTPDGVAALLKKHPITVFFAVPTFYASFLNSPGAPQKSEVKLRHCISAGEALPEGIARKWEERYGVSIYDGLGTTEMLHIFLSNRPGATKYGTTGKPVPGYEIKLLGEDGKPVKKGEMGEMYSRGPTSAVMYWNNREKSRSTFQGEWTRSGDKYIEDEDGYFICCGRADDMLKVSGIYVSPFEVEAALASHPDVLEAAVVGWQDEEKLVKPRAFVVLKQHDKASDALVVLLQEHVKQVLAPYKYPRWIEFRVDLPKTATGKIQRFMLRAEQQG
ncbi:benzoate-CoA ligase family protein [Undibacter mobilis]|uniref:Benzoate-CoA ligase family protein n=1 Tax=Undibacter mobilis TaxID=2292256 RepID=A0A371B9W1_9BRAD|nr:benzoate-CoA ligase family protein [Undibacter mobilis]RDV04376.1 benzoate-CoA ligase family protein [Undibacter mobilis]